MFLIRARVMLGHGPHMKEQESRDDTKWKETLQCPGEGLLPVSCLLLSGRGWNCFSHSSQREEASLSGVGERLPHLCCEFPTGASRRQYGSPGRSGGPAKTSHWLEALRTT